MSVINALLKLGFVLYKPEDGPILIGEDFIDEETDEFVRFQLLYMNTIVTC